MSTQDSNAITVGITAAASGGTSYSTSFLNIESPISEGGIWLNGKADGVAWNNIQTTPGKAFAAAFDTGGGTQDAVAQLKRTFLPCASAQYSEGTIFRNNPTGITHESEVFVNLTIAANSITGYELYWNFAGGNLTLVRWNGAFNDYDALANSSVFATPAAGDVVRLERSINGTTLTAKLNGTTVITFNGPEAQTYLGGNPGIGNNPTPSATLNGIGWASWRCGNVSSGGSGPLFTATGNLTASGQSAPFASGQLTGMVGDVEADLAWETQFFHDTTRGIIHLLAKPAGQLATAWTHSKYTISTGVWAAAVNLGITESGHIYGNATMDLSTGNLYLQATQGDSSSGNNGRLEIYTASTGLWTRSPATLYSSPGQGTWPSNGLGYHPNLFGAGAAGIVSTKQTAGTNAGFALYRLSNGTSSQISTSLQLGDNGGQGVYFAAIDKLIMGGASHSLITGGATPTIVGVGAPPLETRGISYIGATHGTMLQHPGNPSKMMIVEFAGSRWWTSTDGDNWTLQSTSHPLGTGHTSRVLCSLGSNMGCVWMIGTNGGTPISTLWRPTP